MKYLYVEFFNERGTLKLAAKVKDPYENNDACAFINKTCDDNDYSWHPASCRPDSKIPFIDFTGAKYE